MVQDKAIKNLSDTMVSISQKTVEFETNIESNRGDIANNLVQLNENAGIISVIESISEKTTKLETDIQNNKDGASGNSEQLIGLKTELEKLTKDVKNLEEFRDSSWCTSRGTVYILGQ